MNERTESIAWIRCTSLNLLIRVNLHTLMHVQVELKMCEMYVNMHDHIHVIQFDAKTKKKPDL